MDADRERKILSLLSDDPSIILLIKSKYLTHEMWKLCIEKEPELFRCIKDPTYEMCLFAVGEDGRNLKYVIQNNEIPLTQELLWSAVKNYPPAIWLVPPNLRTEPLKECAFDRDPSLMKDFQRLRHSYIVRKIDENPSIIQYLPNQTEEYVTQAVLKDPMCITHVRKISPRIRQLIIDNYPNLIPFLPALKTE